MQVIARAGIASRRAAEDLVTAGRVKVNGEKVLLPQHQVRATTDKVGGVPVLFQYEVSPCRGATASCREGNELAS